MKKVGIITFHASLNHGSVFQAQATQYMIQKLGYEAEIIDYRPETYDIYDKIYCKRNRGRIREKMYYLMMLFNHLERQKRIKKFEAYQEKNIVKSKERIKTYADLSKIAESYDVFVTGSDQVWSKAVPEIVLAGEDAVLAYYLGFTHKKKIAYASSVASMREEDLSEFEAYLNQYSFLSTREQVGVERLQKVTGKKVELVVDPSFLLNFKEWIKFAKPKRIVKESYVLLYSLRNHIAEKNWERALHIFAQKHGLKIVVVAPYFEYKMPGTIDMQLAGPSEFLRLYADASVVCTDTFHGTAFAVNFNKPVYSLGTKYWKEDIRKTSLLKMLGLENRLIDDENDIISVKDYSCDYSKANEILNQMREQSVLYLKKALSDL